MTKQHEDVALEVTASNLLKEDVGMAVSVLQNFRANAQRTLDELRAKNADPALIEAARKRTRSRPYRSRAQAHQVWRTQGGLATATTGMAGTPYPSLRPVCLRSAYAADNPIPIRHRIASERNARSGSPVQDVSGCGVLLPYSFNDDFAPEEFYGVIYKFASGSAFFSTRG